MTEEKFVAEIPIRLPLNLARAASYNTEAAIDDVLQGALGSPEAKATSFHPAAAKDGAETDARDDDGFVTASELREFVYCHRSWFLAQQGFQVSDRAQKAMNTGIVFHEQRAVAAKRGNHPRPRKWAAAIAVVAIMLLLVMKALGH